MGAGFYNLNSLQWLTKDPLTPTRMHQQRSKQSHRVGREGEGMSSNRPELVALRECLEAHPDEQNLLYLTDSEATLQAVNRWIGGGAKLSLAKTADADVLRAIIVKKRKKTWLLGEFEGRWSTRRQGGEWGTDARDGARTGVSERLPSQPRGNVGTVRMDTSACRCRSDMLRSTGAR
jgi:ribonuclease HI